MVVASTQGFPVDNQGNPAAGSIFVDNAELMTFAGPCTDTPKTGVDAATGLPCITINSRGDVLGSTNTPRINIPAGAPVKKVDVFDQTNQADDQTQINFNADQLIGPTESTYFVAYDISGSAVASDLVSVAIRAPTWLEMPDGDNVTQGVYVGETRSIPLGTSTTGYPFVGTNVSISPIELSVSGFTIAPQAATPGQQNVPLMELQMHTNLNSVNLAAMALNQLGTVAVSTPIGNGQGDFSRFSIWLDNGSGVFAPNADTLLGVQVFGSSAAFSTATATVPLALNGVPYLTISSGTVTLFVAADIGSKDRAGQSTLNHSAGGALLTFNNLLAPNGQTVPISPDPLNQPPVESSLVLIQPLTVPSVVVSSSLPPIIITRAGEGIPGNAVGYPAYAKLGCGTDLVNLRNDICRDSNNNALPDQTKWLCMDGSNWLANCPSLPPLIDINGDGIPDNFVFGASTLPIQISLTGGGLPAQDLTGNGILDVDLNQDGIIDLMIPDGFGGFQILLGNDSANQGNATAAVPVPDQGFIPSAWNAASNQLSISLPSISTAGYYQVGVGPYVDTPIGYTNRWENVTVTGTQALKGKKLSVLSSSQAVTTALITNLNLPVPNVAHLTVNLTPSTTYFLVDSAAALKLPGIAYVGSEVMRLQKDPNIANQLDVIAQAGDPSPGNGRGLRGSAPILHLKGEPVSDAAAILFAQFVTASGTTSAPRAILLFRTDATVPSAPGAVAAVEQGQTVFPIEWSAISEGESGIASYEIQERGGAAGDLAANVLWHTLVAGLVPSRLNTYTIGNGNAFPGEGPRPAGEFFNYRVRSVTSSGVVSPWSTQSANVNTGGISAVIAGVSNYPNPFDTRKGGPAGQTTIVYTLGANSTVNLTIYDLLGYVVKSFDFAAGSPGGEAGPNYVVWTGQNGQGRYVSKGGYIARIKVSSPLGSSVTVRKIGVIH
jgi:hypothetical protein